MPEIELKPGEFVYVSDDMLQGSMLTVPEVARMVKVSPATVRKWIDGNFLRASNVAVGKRPSWRIHPDDVAECLSLFEKPRPHGLGNRPQRVVERLLTVNARHVGS